MRVTYKQPRNQKAVLNELAKLAYRAIPTPVIQKAAKQITADCDSRDDRCELDAIFNAVKHGDSRIRGLEKGLRYVADPRRVDLFTRPDKLLSEFCEENACSGDCDDHSALIASLAGAIGFKVGLRAWGPGTSPRGELTHVYAVAGFPKRNPKEAIGMDTTVDESELGWEPPNGHVITAWIEDN